MSYRAPVAPMVGPSCRPRTASDQLIATLPDNDIDDTVTNGRNTAPVRQTNIYRATRGKIRGKFPHKDKHSKEAYQADADEVEQLRDQGDPDYTPRRSNRGGGVAGPSIGTTSLGFTPCGPLLSTATGKQGDHATEHGAERREPATTAAETPAGPSNQHHHRTTAELGAGATKNKTVQSPHQEEGSRHAVAISSDTTGGKTPRLTDFFRKATGTQPPSIHKDMRSAVAEEGEVDNRTQAQEEPSIFPPPSRKRKSDDGAPQPATAPPAKRSCHCAFDACSDETQRARSRYVDSIKRAWGSRVDAWISLDLMPKRPGGVGARKLKDWNTPLLKLMAHLAALTPKQAGNVKTMLGEAVERHGAVGRERTIVKGDVEFVIERVGRVERERSQTLVAGDADRHESVRAESVQNPQVSNGRGNDHSRGTPIASPARDHEVIIKQEPGTAMTLPKEGDFEVSELEVRRARMEATKAEFEYKLQLQQEQRRRRELRERGTHLNNAIDCTV